MWCSVPCLSGSEPRPSPTGGVAKNSMGQIPAIDSRHQEGIPCNDRSCNLMEDGDGGGVANTPVLETVKMETNVPFVGNLTPINPQATKPAVALHTSPKNKIALDQEALSAFESPMF